MTWRAKVGPPAWRQSPLAPASIAAMRTLLALGCCLAAVATAEKTTRALPPFSSLDLGRDGCMPIGVRVVEGDYALEIVAEARSPLPRICAPRPAAGAEGFSARAR